MNRVAVLLKASVFLEASCNSVLRVGVVWYGYAESEEATVQYTFQP